MQTKDQHCLEAINKATDKILEYTSGFNSADEFDKDQLIFVATDEFCGNWRNGQ
jgi:hypothetical protein